ncbi:hypothetical protein CRE_07863 [Caenorhabditis remanei]|uniref:Peptidase A2 domain-containing protein n=1 Tax=Caenorhabditis remanei TaxID=31234 RepID=E3NJH4_CAERE|nr:hypothetical protein CRE_07863 [Caenorhabditis remanei]
MKRLRSPASGLSYTDPKYFTAQIPIRVNGIHFWALVDTGAGFTVAGREICALIGVGKLNPPTVDHALGLGGNEVGMAGSATIKFEIGANTIFQTTNFTSGQCCPEGARKGFKHLRHLHLHGPPEVIIQDICSPKKAPRRVHLDQIKKFVEITGPAATDRDEGPDSDEEAEQDVRVAQVDQVEVKDIDTTAEREVRPLETIPEEDLDLAAEVNDCDSPPTEGDEQQHRYNLRRNRNPPERFEAKFERR